MYYCRICGAEEKSNGQPFESEAQVAGHIQSMRDDEHKGIGKTGAEPHIGTMDKSDTGTDPDGSESDTYVSNPQNAPAENEDNPLTDEPEVENPQSNSNPDEEPNAGTISVECVECGNSNDVSSEVVRDRHFNCGRCGQLNKVPDGVEL